jgi:hypothetical protein
LTNFVYDQIPLINLSVYSTVINDIDNEKVFEDIVTFQKKLESKTSFLDGDTTYFASYEDSTFPKQSLECSKLKDTITEIVCSFLQKEMILESIWSLILKTGESVSVHSHKSNTHMYPNDYFSIAYYVKTPPKSAKLFFEAPYCNTMENVICVEPKNGTLLIFNSFIKHFTERHLASEDRIVVSANFIPKYPNTKPVPDWSAYS